MLKSTVWGCKMDDTKKFISALRGVFESYSRPAPSDAATMIWLTTMQKNGIALPDAANALLEYVSAPGNKFPPVPGDIVEMVKKPVPVELLATTAYGVVMDAVRSVGCYKSVVFDDPAINVAVRSMGGWISLCQSDTPDGVRRSQFAKCYEAALLGVGSVQLPLAGMHGDHVVYIGDRAKCDALLSSQQAKLAGATYKNALQISKNNGDENGL